MAIPIYGLGEASSNGAISPNSFLYMQSKHGLILEAFSIQHEYWCLNNIVIDLEAAIAISCMGSGGGKLIIFAVLWLQIKVWSAHFKHNLMFIDDKL